MNNFKMLLIAGTALAVAVPVRGDSWMPPRQYESFSESSNFVAVVQPGSKTNQSTATVYQIKAGDRTQMWKVALVNAVAPSTVFLSDDGEHIVTLNNWGSGGYGSDVVALYNSKGHLAKYSLEQFAPPPQNRTNGIIERIKEKIDELRYGVSLSTTPDYRDLLSHSTSSRWWNENSLYFFRPHTNSMSFCLWLDWDQRWVAWKLSNGDLIEPTKKQINEWNAEGRRRSLQSIASSNATPADYNFLGRLRFKEDRPLIEKWLADPDFGTGSSQSYSTDDGPVRFTLISYSQNREKADWILARWDNITNALRSSHDTYAFLGSMKGVINLPTPPEKSDGFLRIQLVPDDISGNSTLPEHYLIADLQWSRPTRFTGGQVVDLPIGADVEFAIYGVTPGSYRVQALWDKTIPYCVSTNRICKPSRGDFVSTNSPSVVVRKGEVSRSVSIVCRTPVE